MHNRQLVGLAALGIFTILAFGSAEGDGSASGLGAQAVDDMESIVCEGDDPFKLPIDDEDVIWNAIRPHLTAAEGLYVGEDYFLLMDERELKGEWVAAGDAREHAVEAIGQICSSNTECDGNTCVVEESLFNTQWHLEFRPDDVQGWALVGYFTGTLDKDDSARMAEVATSLEAWNTAIVSALGDGLPEPGTTPASRTIMRSSLLLIGLALTIGCGDKPADDTGSPSTDDTGPAEPVDADGDGFDVTEDCDDGDPDVHPGADEYCNDIDDDCDEQVDEDDAVDAGTWYSDDDFDGYGDPATARQRCEGRSDEVADGTDCDDSDAAVHPAADEICNDIDDDCDGDIDVDAVDAPTWYLDYDADGYGGDAYTEVSCDQPSGFVDNADDCDDTEVTVYPGADEDTCNEIDDDCDGEIDEWETGEAAAQWYEDSDGDGYGNSAVIELLHPSCDGPSGFVAVGGDCDETDAAVFPGAAEACDGSDNDCDGVTDEDDAVDADPWYADADGDGFGWFYDPAVLACSRPTGYVADNTDCDDGDAAVYPGTATCTWATISDIQTGVYVAGDVVTVVGWVMHDALSVGFHLADDAGAYNGVWVYTNGSTMLEGDEVVLFGEISEYNDLTELIVTAPTTDITLLDSGATLPAATVVPTLDRRRRGQRPGLRRVVRGRRRDHRRSHLWVQRRPGRGRQLRLHHRAAVL
jgi:hypothetical protein